MTLKDKVIVGAGVMAAAAYSVYKFHPVYSSASEQGVLQGSSPAHRNRRPLKVAGPRRRRKKKKQALADVNPDAISQGSFESSVKSVHSEASQQSDVSYESEGSEESRSERSVSASKKTSESALSDLSDISHLSVGSESSADDSKRKERRRSRRRRHRSSRSKSKSKSRSKSKSKPLKVPDESGFNLNDETEKNTKSKVCAKCFIIQKQLQYYSEKVADANSTCTDCNHLDLVKDQLLACMNRDILGTVFQPGKSFTSYRIQEDATGYSYSKLFTRFLNDPQLSSVELDDPYIIQQYQFGNLVRLIELIVKTENNVTFIKLKTKPDCLRNYLAVYMSNMTLDLKTNFGVTFEIDINGNLHDREIRLNNGFSVKLGRGLDYFKPAEPHEIGYYDMDMRPCRATTIDIMHTSGSMKN